MNGNITSIMTIDLIISQLLKLVSYRSATRVCARACGLRQSPKAGKNLSSATKTKALSPYILIEQHSIVISSKSKKKKKNFSRTIFIIHLTRGDIIVLRLGCLASFWTIFTRVVTKFCIKVKARRDGCFECFPINTHRRFLHIFFQQQ